MAVTLESFSNRPSISFSIAELSMTVEFRAAPWLRFSAGWMMPFWITRLGEIPMTEHHGAEHYLFRQFLGFRTRPSERRRPVPATTRSSSLSRPFRRSAELSTMFAADEADAGGADRATERCARQGLALPGGGDQRGKCSGSFSMSWESVVTITCVSLRRAIWRKSGRIGRSIRDETSVSFSVGRPSRLK